MHILILSYFFPPYNTIGAIRVGKFAKHLAEFGHTVDVVAARNPALEQNDASLPVELAREHVRYTPWLDFNWLPRAMSGYLQRRRRAVSPWSVSTVTPTVGALPMQLRAFAKLYLSLTNIPDAFQGWAPFADSAGRRIARTNGVDVILASGPPFTSFLVARALSHRLAVPWVADLRDLWADKEPYAFFEIRRNVDRWQQAQVLSTAAGAVTVSEPLAESLRANGLRCPITVVYNGFDPGDLPPRMELVREGPLSLLYTGSLYGDPGPLFRALQLLPDRARNICVEFLLRGDAPSVLELARNHGVADVVTVMDPVAYQASLSKQAAADVLLLIQDAGVRWRGIVSGKIFEYMGAGRPILALSEADTVVAQILATTCAGFTSRDPERIAGWLQARIEQKRAVGIPHTDSDRVADYTRLAQARHLDSFLRDCVA